MARNGSGTYSVVNTFVSGNSITASGHNQNWTDIGTEITNSVAADGQTTITAPIKFANGTAAAPAVTFASDMDTGFFRAAANSIGIAANGVSLGSLSDAGLILSATASFILTATFSAPVKSADTSHWLLPVGTSGQRPTGAAGMLRYNSTNTGAEFYNGSSWISTAPVLAAPQGRLTLTTATPVLITDATAQSTVYYTPYVGNVIPIYDGTSFANTTFAELSMVMSGANFAASGIYDLFVASDSGTVRLAIGPVWGTLTAGSGARGTGAGTTELERKFGIWTNKVSATLRYASGSTFTAAANTATYVGSMFMDGTNSQVSCHVGYGQSRKWGIWNAYNRVPVIVKAGDGTANWAYTTAAYRASNNNSANSIAVFSGLAEEYYDLSFDQQKEASGGTSIYHGIGYNSTAGTSGLQGRTDGPLDGYFQTTRAQYTAPPSIGVNNVNCVEYGGASGSYNGTEVSMLLTARWRA